MPIIDSLHWVFRQFRRVSPAGSESKGKQRIAACGNRHIGHDLANDTGPLDVLRRRHVLVLADDENLRYSARDLGLKVSYSTLGELLRRASRRCALHTFFSHESHDGRRAAYFASRGWVPHGYVIRTVDTCRGPKRLANSDPLILFTAGQLVAQAKPRTVVIASGDGTLVCDLAAFLSDFSKRIDVVTLSLPHSTSSRLDAAINPLISANVELGADCLAAAAPPHRGSPPRNLKSQLRSRSHQGGRLQAVGQARHSRNHACYAR